MSQVSPRGAGTRVFASREIETAASAGWAKDPSPYPLAFTGEAENLVACFERIINQNLDKAPSRAEIELEKATATLRQKTWFINHPDIATICSAWRAMQLRWDSLAIGDHITINWRPTRSSRRR